VPARGWRKETSSFVLGTVNADAKGVTYNDVVNPNSSFFRKTQSFVPFGPQASGDL
jgi:hypothetical protein